MEKVNFEKLYNSRKLFIEKYKESDHVIIPGKNQVLLSAPHAVSQVRLGRLKVAEIGSLPTALYLKNNSDCFLIAKTKNNNDDANFDEHSNYKDSIIDLVRKNNIKYIIDIHGLASKRECDINLGTHLGKNVENNIRLFNNLVRLLKESGFNVSIDQPFMAGAKTISGSIKKEFENVWTIQIEINCDITNNRKNFYKFKVLLDSLSLWLNSIPN